MPDMSQPLAERATTFPAFSAKAKYDEFITPDYTRGLRRELAVAFLSITWGEQYVELDSFGEKVLEEQGYVCKSATIVDDDSDDNDITRAFDGPYLRFEIDWDATAQAIEGSKISKPAEPTDFDKRQLYARDTGDLEAVIEDIFKRYLAADVDARSDPRTRLTSDVEVLKRLCEDGYEKLEKGASVGDVLEDVEEKYKWLIDAFGVLDDDAGKVLVVEETVADFDDVREGIVIAGLDEVIPALGGKADDPVTIALMKGAVNTGTWAVSESNTDAPTDRRQHEGPQYTVLVRKDKNGKVLMVEETIKGGKDEENDEGLISGLDNAIEALKGSVDRIPTVPIMERAIRT
ncbi:uncharacterized protein EV422DRAFT_564628 [Fimicolochytrium jonesii]|uniref:uncharacterized protein n=1 Tax=Fimicolochytrium jonesii TaxID=1396493 RepID=UPI0022FDF6F2|nr:uncharacterized protein EV422DRAFT_564628 [Fimicolochytrium jonesii]KAI8825299.1 hypothetical protein EV422DRAFT_564628 [Fimicolochytrium jonesii]